MKTRKNSRYHLYAYDRNNKQVVYKFCNKYDTTYIIEDRHCTRKADMQKHLLELLSQGYRVEVKRETWGDKRTSQPYYSYPVFKA